MLVNVDMRPDTAYRLDSIPVRPEWGYEQHLYTNTPGVKRDAGDGVYIDTDIIDASYSNPVPITTYEEEVIDVDEARTDYLRPLPAGKSGTDR